VDAPRGRTFVSLQRSEGASWRTVGTDDSFLDTTALGDDGVWTETWQFGACSTLGTYRFLVRGVADKGAGPAPYEAVSQPFTLGPMTPLQVTDLDVSGGVARVTAVYPDPGAGALISLPRRVRGGFATLKAGAATVTARPDAGRLRFQAAVPEGAPVEVVRVQDGCGNALP
jgi:hypothetical protein